MRIERMLAPVHALGPGQRVCLWTKGCSKCCPGCISPEMQDSEGPELDEALLAKLLTDAAARSQCTGLTVSGGDPMEQPQALLKLLRLVRPNFEDILVYTGYTLGQLREHCGEDAKACLDLIDVLIDGPYVESRNHPDCVLRGSDNQCIHYLNPEAEPRYADYMQQGRQLETFVHNRTIVITGIQNRRTEV